jgi:tellurite resistance-related uncharacterized protein
MVGSSPLRITSYNPKEVLREKDGLPSSVGQITVNGYNLDGATVRLMRDGQDVPAVVTVVSSSSRQAVVSVDALATAPLGIAQLVFSKPGQADVSVDLRISEQTQLPGAIDTLLLWNLNETGNGAVRVFDSGALGLNGTAGPLSQQQTGRYGMARSKANIFSDPDNDALYLGASSFTAECWFKTGPVTRGYALFGKEDSFGGSQFNPEFSLRIVPSGALRAYAYDTSFRQWKAEMSSLTYTVDDNLWHHVAMVADRAAQRLSIYVDGVERAFAPMPANFGALTKTPTPLRVGHWAFFEDNVSGGPEEFPGTIDDVRLSNTAHGADRIRADLDGVPGLRINSYGPKEIPRSPAAGPVQFTSVTATGFGLDGVTATVVRDGVPLDATVIVDSSSFYQAQLRVAVAANVATGAAQLVFAKPGLPSVPLDIRIAQQSEFVIDNDTRLLWHLNETANGSVHVADAGPLSIGGTADALSVAEPAGHFGYARSKADIFSDPDFDALYLGSSSFTAECWFKTNPVTRGYTLIGKEDSFGGSQFNPEFSLRIVPSGALRAYAYDTSFRQWRAEMVGRVYDPATGRWKPIVDDNEWHHVAMVLDRANQRLSIYVDGVERAFAPMPANFGALTKTPTPLRAGHWAFFEDNAAGGPEEFPGTIDDVRLSNTAHSVDRIRADLDAVPTLRINSYGPKEIPRSPAAGPAQFTSVTATGYGLDGVTATVVRDGLPLDAAVIVDSSSLYQAQLRVSVAANVVPGMAQLVFAKPGLPSAPVDIRISQQSEFAIDSDTRLLWHLNETANGSVHIADAGPLSLGGTTDALSVAEPAGHFGYARSKADIFSDPDFDALYLGSSSFTAECWFKTNPVTRGYTLIGKEDSFGGSQFNPEFSLRIVPSGALRAYAYDTSFRQWRAEMVGRVYDPATGRWKPIVDDNEWHHVAMVLDRANQRLSIYVDGVERAFAPMPANFGALTKTPTPLRAGHWAFFEDNAAGGPEEFPGTIDEVRISTTAHSAARVLADTMGTDAARVTLVQPAYVPTGNFAVPVKFTGYGLAGATVVTDHANVPITVTSTSLTEINGLLDVPANAQIGPLNFTITTAAVKTLLRKSPSFHRSRSPMRRIAIRRQPCCGI